MRVLAVGEEPMMQQFRKVVNSDELLQDVDMYLKTFGMDAWGEISRNPFFYDVLFVDVEIGAARNERVLEHLEQLRAINPNMLFVVVTSGRFLSVKMLQAQFFGALSSSFDREEVRELFLKLRDQVDLMREMQGPELLVSKGDFKFVISAGQVYFGEKDRNGMLLTTKHGRFLCRTKLDDFEKDAPDRFCRCSSSVIVNFDYVIDVNHPDLRLICGDNIRITRNYKKAVKQFLEAHFFGAV